MIKWQKLVSQDNRKVARWCLLLEMSLNKIVKLDTWSARIIRFCNFTLNTFRLKSKFKDFYSHDFFKDSDKRGVAEDKGKGSAKPNVFDVLMNVQRSYDKLPPSRYAQGYILNLDKQICTSNCYSFFTMCDNTILKNTECNEKFLYQIHHHHHYIFNIYWWWWWIWYRNKKHKGVAGMLNCIEAIYFQEVIGYGYQILRLLQNEKKVVF